MLKLEGGFGYVGNELDTAPGITSEQTTTAWYLQAAISPVKNMFIIPELGVVDYGDLEVTGTPDTDIGSGFYFGVKCQINF
jgi:hypothetical protein